MNTCVCLTVELFGGLQFTWLVCLSRAAAAPLKFHNAVLQENHCNLKGLMENKELCRQIIWTFLWLKLSGKFLQLATKGDSVDSPPIKLKAMHFQGDMNSEYVLYATYLLSDPIYPIRSAAREDKSRHSLSCNSSWQTFREGFWLMCWNASLITKGAHFWDWNNYWIIVIGVN